MSASGMKSRRKSSPASTPKHRIVEAPSGVAAPTVLILNPTAGRGRAARIWAELRDELNFWRTKPRILETTHAGHGAQLAREAVADGASLVIAAGGDGTAHEIVQGLMDMDASASGTAFAHLPLGTGCDLARGLGLPLNPAGILRGLRKGRTTYLDIGVADMSRGAETVRRYFLNAANIGLGAAVARRVKGSRGLQRLGRYSYKVASLQELFNARPYQISWRTDDGREADGLVLQMFVCNGPSVAGGMNPCADASFTSGELHVVVAGPLRLGAALAQFRRLDRRRTSGAAVGTRGRATGSYPHLRGVCAPRCPATKGRRHACNGSNLGV